VALLRTAGDPTALVPSVRAVLHDLDPKLALMSVDTMDGLRNQSLARARFLTLLLGVFAMVGIVLAVVGVYGVLAQLSRNRTREFGIRVALGAQAGQVQWLVVRQGLRLALLGLVGGGLVALFTVRLIAKLLFNVAPNDPETMVAVIVLLTATSVAASWIPARKASRADPAIALRSD
jgi:putative ABC transport system permease protein